MKNRLFIALLLNMVIFCYGQEQVFNVTPSSPTISSLGKYIDFPISLYTGQAEVSVSIYNLKAKDISVPISLQYHTGGIRVEEISSSVGLGWSLRSNNTIIRVVNGAFDDGVPFFYEEPPYLLSSEKLGIHKSSISGVSFDTEHDYYYFNAGPYSGKYVIDFKNNNTPVLIPRQDIKIENVFGAQIITTPDGLIYTFGASENNSTVNQCLGSGIRSNRQYKPTTWFLTRIESQTSNTFVNFIYENKHLEYEQNGSQTKNEFYLNGSNIPDSNCTLRNDINTKRLITIESSDGQKIDFVYNNLRADLENDSLLSEIVISSSQGSFLKKYKLTHKHLDRGSLKNDLSDYDLNTIENWQRERLRPVLTKVEEVGKNDVSLPPYSFEYNITGYGLPSRRSYSQDHWGYFNNKNNNTLVPAMIFNHKLLQGADRTPDAVAAIQGTLKKINFPTGGNKTFTYELNECDNCSFFGNVNNAGTGSGVHYETHSIGDNDFSANSNQTVFESLFTVTGYEHGEIIFDLSTETPYYTNVNNGGDNVEFNLYSLNEDSTINQKIFKSSQYREEDDLNNLYLKIDHVFHGKYKLEMIVHEPEWASEQDAFSLSVKWITVSPPVDSNNQSTTPINKFAGGLRVSQIKIEDPVLQQTIQKKYKYENGAISRGISYARYSDFISSQNGHMVTFGNNFIRSSNPIISLSKTKGGVVGYGKVTIEEGNGYVENYFYSFNDNPDTSWNVDDDFSVGIGDVPERIRIGDRVVENREWNYPYSLIDEKDWKRGLLKEQKIFNQSGFLVKHIENKYNFYDDSNHSSYDPQKIYSVKGSRSEGLFWSVPFSTGPGSIVGIATGKLSVNFYTLESSWYDLVEKRETLFFENSDPIIATTNYFYDNDEHLQLTRTETTNSKGEVLKTEIAYAHEKKDIRLIDENRILIPLNQKSYKGTTELSEQNIIYEDSNGNYLPKIIQTSKGSNSLEDKVIYHSYDSKGNPLEVSKKDGTHIVYIWGYQQTQPIAKIENATYTGVTTAIASLHEDYNSLLKIQAISNNDDDNTIGESNIGEGKLRKALKTLRNASSLSNAQVTTYTYDPLIGVTSITDPRGNTIYYTYDDFNRLQSVKDHEGHILSKNEYNYKN